MQRSAVRGKDTAVCRADYPFTGTEADEEASRRKYILRDSYPNLVPRPNFLTPITSWFYGVYASAGSVVKFRYLKYVPSAKKHPTTVDFDPRTDQSPRLQLIRQLLYLLLYCSTNDFIQKLLNVRFVVCDKSKHSSYIKPLTATQSMFRSTTW